MTHDQWHVRIKRALASANRQPKSAVRTLRALVGELEAQVPRGIDQWHLAQTRYVLSLAQSSAGDDRASAATLQRIAEQHELELRYHARGLVSACAAAALQLARNGDRGGAARMLRKAAPWSKSLRPKDKLLDQARSTIRSFTRTRRRKPAG